MTLFTTSGSADFISSRINAVSLVASASPSSAFAVLHQVRASRPVYPRPKPRAAAICKVVLPMLENPDKIEAAALDAKQPE